MRSMERAAQTYILHNVLQSMQRVAQPT